MRRERDPTVARLGALGAHRRQRARRQYLHIGLGVEDLPVVGGGHPPLEDRLRRLVFVGEGRIARLIE